LYSLLAVKIKEEDEMLVLTCPAETEFEIAKTSEDKPLDGSMGTVTIEEKAVSSAYGN
jgi:hypothetical protein